MSRYQQLRSSSPSHDHRTSKEIELEEQLPDQTDHEKTQSPEDEQTERLLPGGGQDDVHPENVGASRTPQRRWLRLGLFGLAAVMLISIAAVLLSLYSASDHEDRILRTFRTPSSDYIIPPDWDFDASPKARYYHWTITDITANPDGVFRPLMVINGQFPGPMIVCNDGDTIVVDVVNNAKNATAIHWHGLFQNGTNFMDGTVGITQCPIAPGQSFRYQFTVKGQAGSCKCAPKPPFQQDFDSNSIQTSTTAIRLLRAWMACLVHSSSCPRRRLSRRPTIMIQIVSSWSRIGTMIPRTGC